MSKPYRPGALGALMDEYERAASEFRTLLGTISEAQFEVVRDEATTDPDCRSIQTISSHVVFSGYGYSNLIRGALEVPKSSPERRLLVLGEMPGAIDSMLAYTSELFEGRWRMSDEEIQRIVMKPSWGGPYDLEQLLEHAIVHVLRHRRQVERMLAAAP